MNMNKLSIVLLSWKRPENIPIILSNLYSSNRVDEIILWNNNPEINIEYMHHKLQVINSPKNYGPVIRYCLANALKNQNILFQDDDLYLTEDQIEVLFEEYSKDTSRIYGPQGRKLDNYKYVMKNSCGYVDIIIGITTLFHKKHLYKFFKYLGPMGGGFESVLLHSDDILFSLSMKTKHKVVDIGDINKLPDHDALSHRLFHLQSRQEMVNYCLRVIPGLRKVIDSNE